MIRRPLRTRVVIRPRANPPIRLPSPIGRLHERVRRPVLVARGRRDLLRQHDARHREHADRELADRALERVRQQHRLVAQELPADAEVAPDRVHADARLGVLEPVARHCRLGALGRLAVLGPSRPLDDRRDDDRRQQHRGAEVGHGVEPEREGQRRGEEHHEQAGDGVVDDVGDGLADPHRGVRRQQVALVDDPRQDRHPGGPEEDRHRRDQEHQRVRQPDVDQHGDGHEQHQRRAQQVGHDEDLLLVPAIDQGPGDGREDQVRDRRHQEGQRRRRSASR